MKKTSVYLDDERKDNLDRVAEITGRSQSDLIRDGVDHVIAQHLRRQSRLLSWRLQWGADTQGTVDQALEGFGQ
jgi:predicted transcriptional regulator